MTKMIEYYVNHIKEELADAKHYAQRYEEYKTSRNTFAKMYYDMAKDELEHAKYLKIMGQVAIEETNEAITAQIMEMWTNCMNEYAEHTAMLKMML